MFQTVFKYLKYGEQNRTLCLQGTCILLSDVSEGICLETVGICVRVDREETDDYFKC